MSLRDTRSGRRTHSEGEAWRRRPCQDFQDILPLLHDHELGPAEAAELEMHLGDCARCQAQADAYERLSSVLKRWDANEEHPPIPHLRMQHAVLARVAEHGAHRRAADRMVRYTRLATAACVVLALGVAALAGLSVHDRAPTSDDHARVRATVWPADEAYVSMPPLPDREPLVSPAEASTQGVSNTRWMEARLPALPAQPAWADLAPLRREAVQRMARLQRIRREVNDLARRIDGEATVWFGIDGRGMHRIGAGALAYLRQSGILAQWRLEMDRARTTLESTSWATPIVSRSRLRPRDVLAGVPGLSGDSMAALHGMSAAKRVDGLRLGGVPAHSLAKGLRTQDGGASWIEALDPLAAQADGRLRFAETHGFDVVVAFVKGTGKPIFIPDGQLLVRGAKDRVVAKPIWLPACETETRFVIPCAVVQRGVRRMAPRPPMLSEWIAGPTVRSLLRRDASEAELLEVISSQLRIVDPIRFEGAFTSWSLTDLPQATRFTAKSTYAQYGRTGASRIREEIRDDAIQGFVAEGRGAGRRSFLYGVELTRIRGDAGAALLTRLFLSYALESAVMVQMQNHATLGSFHEPVPAGAAYQKLGLDDRGMGAVEAVGQPSGVRSLRRSMRVAKKHRVHVEVLDVRGTAPLVSVTSEGVRERP